MDKKEFLKTTDIFRYFSDAALETLSRSIKENSCAAEEKIFSEGDTGKLLFILTEGEVVISKKTSPEKEKVLAVLGSGSIFGEAGLFSNVPRTADAKAKTAVKFYTVDSDTLKKVSAEDPGGMRMALESLLLSALERLEQTSRELAAIYEISNIISENLRMQDFSRKSLDQILHSVPNMDSGALYLWNEFTDEYEPASSIRSGVTPDLKPGHPLIKFLSANPSGSCIIEDSAGIREILADLCDENMKSILVTPMAGNNAILGFILLQSRAKTVIHGSRMKDLMNSISAQLVSAVANIRNREEETARERLNRGRENSGY